MASIASSRTAQRSIVSKRLRSTYSTPCQVFTPMATRTTSRASHCSSSRRSAVGAGPRSPEGRGSARRTPTSSAPADASPWSRPASRRPDTNVPASRNSSNQARLVAATSALGASSPVWAMRSQPSRAARSVRLWRSIRPLSAAEVRERTAAARGRTSPNTPVATAMAPRKTATRSSNSASSSAVATPSRTRVASPSPKIARSGAWTGSSWSSRIASSRDGTPAPSSRAARRAH